MIDKRLYFNDFREFFGKRDVIKDIYDGLSTPNKWVYKYYVYSNRRMKECSCDTIWLFLNANEDDEDYVTYEMLLKEFNKYKA